jgi:tripartite-type tricarboxylate transporter receptor subunit TctC
MAAPVETPQEIITKLENAFEKAVSSQEFIDWTVTTGITASFKKGEELKSFINNLQAQEFKYLDELKNNGVLK